MAFTCISPSLGPKRWADKGMAFDRTKIKLVKQETIVKTIVFHHCLAV
jgi:hypothetical protein